MFTSRLIYDHFVHYQYLKSIFTTGTSHWPIASFIKFTYLQVPITFFFFFKVLKYFKSLSVCYTLVIRFQTGKVGNIFFEVLDSSATVRLSVKETFIIARNVLLSGRNLLIWKLKEYYFVKPSVLLVMNKKLVTCHLTISYLLTNTVL